MTSEHPSFRSAGPGDWVLFALWALAFLGAFLGRSLLPPGSVALAPGIEGALWLSGMQLLASLIAMVILLRARRLAPGSLARRLAWGPAVIAVVLVTGVLAATFATRL